MSLQQRARDSGTCPPSLLSEERLIDEDGFEAAVLKVIDGAGFFLQPESDIASDFMSVIEKVECVDKILGSADVEIKKKALDYRRCVVLAIVGATPTETPSLGRIMSDGYLASVKSWLDDILSTPEGGVDLLLHLLSNITSLPVTKSTVKDSGMGKAIGSVEKHRLCKGTPNESAIKARVQQIKDAWHASVKARKPLDYSKEGAKRPSDASSSTSSAKRVKMEIEPKKSSSFTTLLKKVSALPDGAASGPSASANEKWSKASSVSSIAGIKTNGEGSSVETGAQTNGQSDKKAKKTALRVKWADHFGGKISVAKVVEGEDIDGLVSSEASVSWSDRKKRDRMREKELLAKAKKSKLLDDDDMDLPKPMQPTASWRVPSLLPERPDVTAPQLSSSELSRQDERMTTVSPARYTADHDVPNSPAPLSDVEQALDMTSQASAVVAPIPFFVPQQTLQTASPAAYIETAAVQPSFPATIAPAHDTPATPEFVQSLGLPMFLVGQPVHVLKTLAGSPSLLGTLVDANGMYDQARFMNLVQTLLSAGSLPMSAPTLYQSGTNVYGAPLPAASYGEPFQNSAVRSGIRAGKSDDGNLHVSGYGPGTTEADIVAAFAPYVQTDEVVLKGTFAFVNTSDPVNAQRAREALNGTLLGGMPIRINSATRKTRENSMAQYGGAPLVVPVPSFPGPTTGVFGSPAAFAPPSIAHGMPPPSFGVHPDVDTVRDDRGNPSTKNLFVAGYGPGTTEQQLRDLVGQFAIVTGVVSKGTFAFVNTSDRSGAVAAREHLGGTMFNGGVLRINFAKETGRLGTSFDLTYGPNTGPNANRAPGPPPSMSYYGRGGY